MFGEMEKKNKIFAVVISFNPDIHLLNAEYHVLYVKKLSPLGWLN